MRPDARGWIGISVFVLTIMVLWMVFAFPELRKDEFFKVLATAIVLTGYIGGVVGWAFSATKQGGELADRAANLVETHAAAAAAPPPPQPAAAAPAPSYDGPDLSAVPPPAADTPEEPQWH